MAGPGRGSPPQGGATAAEGGRHPRGARAIDLAGAVRRALPARPGRDARDHSTHRRRAPARRPLVSYLAVNPPSRSWLVLDGIAYPPYIL